MEGMLSPADVAVLSGNGRNTGNDAFGDNGAWWIIIFLIFALGGFRGNGFGGFGGSGSGVGENYILATDFEYTPSCNRCNDTGFHNGKLCACVKKQYIIALAKECDILNRAPFSFKDCNTNGMDEVQGKALKKLYEYAEEYVAKYPAVTKNILVFTGATGTGKSCLASAIARKAVLERGKSALVLTAYEFNST